MTDKFSFDEKVDFLKNLGCGNVGHKNQTLLDHLLGVYKLLKSWVTNPRGSLDSKRKGKIYKGQVNDTKFDYDKKKV